MLRLSPPADPAAVARAIAAALAPARAPDPAPDWLDPDQADAFRILLHALRTDGAALCAEPVGTGKTYLALAIALALGGEPPPCLVPTSLVPQWQATASRLGVPVLPWSHALASRGRLPPGNPSLVIIDESHHFRRPDTVRFRTVAPWLVGRRLLLLSATPIVNSAWDLYHQLHLGLRDDILALDGAPTLRGAFRRDEVPAALGRHVLQRLTPTRHPPTRATSHVLASGALPLLEGLDRLALSEHPGIAALVRSVLLCAAASSARALHAALLRYRTILHHARDATEAGRTAARRGLRKLLAGAGDQLEFWTLLPEPSGGDAMVLDDLPRVERLLDGTRSASHIPDEKARHLGLLLGDRRTTLVFVSTPDTIPFLRDGLRGFQPAWCTGSAAGIGAARLRRQDVLGWFRPGAASTLGKPSVLISTDVAAEGLDLQAAERVVHYDLPWTDVRLAQRDGRAVRRGSQAPGVELVRYLPAPPVEERLRQVGVIARKAALPAKYGIGPVGRARWSWRGEISSVFRGCASEGVAVVRSSEPGVLLGVALERDGAPEEAIALWRPTGGDWTADPTQVQSALRRAIHDIPGDHPDLDVLARELESVDPLIRRLLRAAMFPRQVGIAPTPDARRFCGRLRGLARRAVRDRDPDLLPLIERAIQFGAGGKTAGEEMLVHSLLRIDDRRLLARLPSMPVRHPPGSPIRARLVGAIQFREGESSLPSPGRGPRLATADRRAGGPPASVPLG